MLWYTFDEYKLEFIKTRFILRFNAKYNTVHKIYTVYNVQSTVNELYLIS